MLERANTRMPADPPAAIQEHRALPSKLRENRSSVPAIGRRPPSFPLQGYWTHSANAATLRVLLFEWDSPKAAINLRKHKVSFQEAATVFSDPLSATIPDPDHSTDESRYLIIGQSHRSDC